MQLIKTNKKELSADKITQLFILNDNYMQSLYMNLKSRKEQFELYKNKNNSSKLKFEYFSKILT